jgi:hypothetical protein
MNGRLDIHPKVAGATLAGALAVLIVWILSLVGIPVPDVADAALVTVLSGLGGWLAPAGYAAPKQPVKVALHLDGKKIADAISDPGPTA